MESLEIVEITDSSISIDAHLKDITLEASTTNKRPLELCDDSELEVQVSKKPCPGSETQEEVGIDTEESKIDASVIDETIVSDETALCDTNILDCNITNIEKDEEAEKSLDLVEEEEEPMLQELPSSQEIVDDEEEGGEEEQEEEEGDFNESDNLDSSDEDNDDDLMARAEAKVMATAQTATRRPQISNDEPIALDDSDDEVVNQPSYRSEDDEFSVDNNVIAEDSEEEEERDMRPKKSRQQISAEKLVKKYLKLSRTKKIARLEKPKASDSVEIEKDVTSNEKNEKIEERAEMTKKIDASAEVVPMEVEPEQNNVQLPQKTDPPPVAPTNHEPVNAVPTTADINESARDVVKETVTTEKNGTASSLLQEIVNSSTEEIFNRYVFKSPSDTTTPTLDEFSEELFACLQQNKQELEKAAQLWNEKLHIKYKIRELMESIRRHRAVMEIETFGYKQPNNSHPIISSKSSTTTNSEADHHEKQFRMSTESVTRLIQDVRASMLKREDKTQSEESWNNIQVGQGRQGQIIDVQSIINDFRQKNPQEVPRRGRRMKVNSYGFENQQMDETRGTSGSNNSHDFSGSTKSGYPEVSLLPVQNFYKNLSNQIPGPSGTSPYGQKSSLLQSILTKQSTKSPAGAGFQPTHSLPTTSTLARLLTAPERSLHSAPKHSLVPASARPSNTKMHHNGEITITPIAHHLSGGRNKDFSMDDEDNSMEPPLVIDETEDLSFDMSDRSMNKSVSDLLCQGCKKNKAFFMCAGCSRQWYCSKECQEMAWDEHAESCMT